MCGIGLELKILSVSASLAPRVVQRIQITQGAPVLGLLRDGKNALHSVALDIRFSSDFFGESAAFRVNQLFSGCPRLFSGLARQPVRV